jgi:hypothetical protein
MKDITFASKYKKVFKKVFYSGRDTVVLWMDGTSTCATCSEQDNYSRESGFLVCLWKHVFDAPLDYITFEKELNNV